MLTTPLTKSQSLWQGARDTFPMMVSAAPFGLIFGLQAVSASVGLSLWATLGMSLWVFAGSSQFIALTLLAQGATLPVIILTTFVVNARHALYAASLVPYLRGVNWRWIAPLAFWLTDETYATVIHRWNADDMQYKVWYQLGSSLAMYINWFAWTALGALAGARFAQAANWGLDFAMVVVFIGIVVPMLTRWPMVACGIVAGVVGVLANGLPYNLGLLIAASAGILTGIAVEGLGTDKGGNEG
ncbi:MAG: AzlC family ABC transporter permease [Phototrophicaceae bacterium]|jgi:4-azaleucine resistance transporter AzlC